MTRLFLLFVIALLPLRGWTAEIMLVQMETGGAAVTLGQTVRSVRIVCPLHLQALPDVTAAAAVGLDAGSTADNQGCKSCQLCMPLGAVVVPTLIAMHVATQTVTELPARRFVSAETRRQPKPPNS